jgi:serine/threonine-protein kinase
VTAGSELTPGTSVDRRYRIQCTLGRGGFGRTYLASDERRFNELCVLKEFVPNSQADPVIAQKLRELFQREASILHKLDHSQIPKFFAGFEENQRLFIAQEYIDGKTYWRLLQERQRQGRSFSQQEIVEWLHDLLQVLDYLHCQNIVHRDISPDNIMLPRGRKTPVLIDFGVVKQVLPQPHVVNPNDADDLIQASVSVGKFGYAPNEQIRMGQCSPRSDLYALAVTAVVLLTGKPPNLLIDSKSLEWRWKRWLKLDPRLTQILDRMMAEKPQDRFASAKVVLQALQPLYKAPDSHSVQSNLVYAERRVSKQLATQPSTQPGNGEAALRSGRSSNPALRQASIAKLTASGSGMAERATPQHRPDWAIKTDIAGVVTSTQVHTEPVTLSVQGQQLTQIEDMSSTPTHGAVETRSKAKPHELLHLLHWFRGAVLQMPQDQLGNPPALQWSLKRLLAISALVVLPVAGAAVGVRSPYMASICVALSNCAIQTPEQRYQLALDQANSANLLTEQARNLDDLQNARRQLAESISQLSTFSLTTQSFRAVNLVLPKYQTLLASLDQTLEKETRAASLLNRAEAEAQKAAEQSKIAKTVEQYQAAQLQWQRALATLGAISDSSFVANQVETRLQEYTTRLDAVKLKLMALAPKSAPKSDPDPTIVTVVIPTQPLQVLRAAPATNVTTAATAPSITPTKSAQPVVSKPQSASRTRSASTARVTPRRVARSSAPATSPLEVDSRWIAGSLITSATQTLDNVSIWIDGTRTEADGKFVANLWIQNRSRQGFGFVPLYAESRDANGNTLRSRVLFTSANGTMLEPGKSLMGQIYLMDRPAAQQLTLVIQESTSGSRQFRIPF